MIRFSELAMMTDKQKKEEKETLKEHLSADPNNRVGVGFDAHFRRQVARYSAKENRDKGTTETNEGGEAAVTACVVYMEL